MFSPQSSGFVFVVPDWMAFSTEVDSFRSAWMQAQKRRISKRSRGW
jgi:P2-related tail formation protein